MNTRTKILILTYLTLFLAYIAFSELRITWAHNAAKQTIQRVDRIEQRVLDLQSDIQLASVGIQQINQVNSAHERQIRDNTERLIATVEYLDDLIPGVLELTELLEQEVAGQASQSVVRSMNEALKELYRQRQGT